MATIIDKEKFYDLYSDYGNDFMLEIIEIFFDEYDEKINNIEDGIKTRDANKVHFWAHKLKGSIKAFSDHTLPSEVAFKLEMAGKESRFTEFEKLYIELKELCVLFMKDLIEIKAELQN